MRQAGGAQHLASVTDTDGRDHAGGLAGVDDAGATGRLCGDQRGCQWRLLLYDADSGEQHIRQCEGCRGHEHGGDGMGWGLFDGKAPSSPDLHIGRVRSRANDDRGRLLQASCSRPMAARREASRRTGQQCSTPGRCRWCRRRWLWPRGSGSTRRCLRSYKYAVLSILKSAQVFPETVQTVRSTGQIRVLYGVKRLGMGIDRRLRSAQRGIKPMAPWVASMCQWDGRVNE